MKNGKRVLHRSLLPTKLPLSFTALCLICLDHWGANDIIRGVVYSILALFWAVAFYGIYVEKSSYPTWDISKDGGK